MQGAVPRAQHAVLVVAHTDEVSAGSRLLQGLLHLVEARVFLGLLRYEVHGALPVVKLVALLFKGSIFLVFVAAGVHGHVFHLELTIVNVFDVTLASDSLLRLRVLWVLLLALSWREHARLFLLDVTLALLHKHNGRLQLPLSLFPLFRGIGPALLVLRIRHLPLLLIVLLVLAVVVQVRIGRVIELLPYPFGVDVAVQFLRGFHPPSVDFD